MGCARIELQDPHYPYNPLKQLGVLIFRTVDFIWNEPSRSWTFFFFLGFSLQAKLQNNPNTWNGRAKLLKLVRSGQVKQIDLHWMLVLQVGWIDLHWCRLELPDPLKKNREFWVWTSGSTNPLTGPDPFVTESRQGSSTTTTLDFPLVRSSCLFRSLEDPKAPFKL